MRDRDLGKTRSIQPPVSVPTAIQVAKYSAYSGHFLAERGLLHNHPSGDPTPSRADIQMTQSIIDVARPLGITVHDHIIVGKDGHASFKGLKLI